MSVSTEVQRTLVKSPPELWSELSNPEALARHLAELGEIRITSVEPETKVEWEAEGTTGVVHLKQSGWGTKVTLSVTHLLAVGDEQPESMATTEPTATIEPTTTTEPTAETKLMATTAPAAETEPYHEPIAAGEPAPEPNEPEAISEPKPQPGFFARLFRRRKIRAIELVETEPVETEQERKPIVVVEPETDFEALAAPEPVYELTPAPAADLATELASVEAQMAEETTELLTGVLDRLGAAHHRPFSRG